MKTKGKRGINKGAFYYGEITGGGFENPVKVAEIRERESNKGKMKTAHSKSKRISTFDRFKYFPGEAVSDGKPKKSKKNNRTLGYLGGIKIVGG